MSSDVPVHGAHGRHEAREPVGRAGAAAPSSLSLGFLLLGVVLAAVSQLVLDRLADSTLAWHWLQHGTLFLGGVSVGVAITLLYWAGHPRG